MQNDHTAATRQPGGWNRGSNRGYNRGGRGRGGQRFGGRHHGHGGWGRGRGRGRGRGGRGNNFHHNNNNNNQPYNNNSRPPLKDVMEQDMTVIEEIQCSSKNKDSSTTTETETVRIAVEGCCHGELEAIYSRLQRHERETNCPPIDLLLCCGDFESLRNLADLHSIAVPPKYRSMGSFHRYYSGELVAPYLTLFVAGNHESSQALQELHYGGWVAPNIYYLGAAGVVNYRGLRIGGISGIYKEHDYLWGRHEKPPYNPSSLRSVYHVRNVDVYRMSCLSKSHNQSQPESLLDVMISHDWPQGVEQHGDTNSLLRRKPHFRSEVERNALGSPANHTILVATKPKWWFAAHLHVKFRATVRHGPKIPKEEQKTVTGLVPSSTIGSDTRKRKAEDDAVVSGTAVGGRDSEEETGATEEGNNDNEEEQNTKEEATEEGEDVTTQFVALSETKESCNDVPDLTDLMTQFLSLDKCLPRRHFLTIVEVPTTSQKQSENKLEYDLEWLAMLRKTHHLSTVSRTQVAIPSDPIRIEDEDLDWIRQRLESASLQIPEKFVQTVPPIASGTCVDPLPRMLPPPLEQMGNPQTDQLLKLLELDHVITIPYSEPRPVEPQSSIGTPPEENNDNDDNEINLDGDDGAAKDSNEAPPSEHSNEIDIEGGD